ncbi:glycoprotease [Selenomonas dianae]|uniref:Glycoprotease n=1 Tax=Selenomonas dianae TaxID=135079 RepID=A0ABP3CG38_9FIRM|nr:glycoprotease [Selenomonas dianae]WLD83137.1 glycoprotease [Selenomonas dianae]
MDEEKRKKQAHIIALLLTVVIVIFGFAYVLGHYAGHAATQEKPAVMTQEQTQDAAVLRAQLDISRANANALQQRLAEAQAGQRAPTTTYYVSAPTVERAAQVVERQIREDDPTLPRAAREKSDRTVVTPITKDKDGKQLPTEKQKVDVYKINLRKDHRIKAGASVIDGKALMSIGYEQGRFEALAHFDGGRYKGATVTYNIIEW